MTRRRRLALFFRPTFVAVVAFGVFAFLRSTVWIEPPQPEADFLVPGVVTPEQLPAMGVNNLVQPSPELSPDEVVQTPRSWAEKAYPKLIYYNRLEKGGHFAAWEQPDIFANEVRAAFKSLR